MMQNDQPSTFELLNQGMQLRSQIDNAPLLKSQNQAQAQIAQAGAAAVAREDSLRKAGIIYNYANQLKAVPMAQRRTFLASIPPDVISGVGLNPEQLQGMAIDDASIDTTIAQLQPLLQQQGAQQQGPASRRSQDYAGGRITVQEMTDGTVRYMQFGKEIPPEQVQAAFESANKEHLGEQERLNYSRRSGSLAAELGYRPEIVSRETSERFESKGEENRAQTVIDSGLDASQGLPELKRSLELLNEVDTGGIDAVALKIQQAFGVEGANPGELSYNLGKSVISQLKSMFGGAFTNDERKRLEQIEAGFGKSPATNKRLISNTIQIVERKAKRAIERAEDRGDYETADEIRANMEAIMEQRDEVKPTASKPAASNDFEGFEIIE
jgi:hypothetical protein